MSAGCIGPTVAAVAALLSVLFLFLFVAPSVCAKLDSRGMMRAPGQLCDVAENVQRDN